MAVVAPSSASLATEVDLEPLRALVASCALSAATITPMPGGASSRRYFRVELSEGDPVVGMFVPDGAKPEEVQKAHAGTRWPFLEVRDLLDAHGIDVPRVLGEDTEAGWLLIEDLGEDTLANFLLTHESDREELYRRAVRDVARAQKALSTLPAGCVIGSRQFDYDLLRWEIEHFREWGLDARGSSLSEADASRWTEIADRLARRVASLTQGFVHRDYQSRNLMVLPRSGSHPPPSAGAPAPDLRLVWIDFQDALLGPRVYDLVALLNDSYQDFDRAFVEARLEDYARAADLPPDDASRLVSEFDLVTVQRKLKDAGRFVFIDRVKGNPGFLHFVTPTVHKVKGALERLSPTEPDMAELLDILRRTLGDEMA